MGAGKVRVAQSAMQSPVNWALLGLVIERPSYAYELAQRFDRTYEGALSLSSTSHVYTALRALEDRGLIEEVPGSGTGRQPKPCYRASAGAVQHYQRWLVSQLAEERRRQRLFAMELAALMSDPGVARDVIDGYEQECVHDGGERPLRATGHSAVEVGSPLAARLASEQNRLAVGARLEWIQYVRRELKALAERKAPAR
jgi:DNA-binding PadR family transcriptional regulator